MGKPAGDDEKETEIVGDQIGTLVPLLRAE